MDESYVEFGLNTASFLELAELFICQHELNDSAQ